MAYAVLVKSKVAAKNVDSRNRAGQHTSALENGCVGSLTLAAGTEVGTYAAPATGALTNLWMVASPEIVLTGSYKIGANDPRDFINAANTPFDAFLPDVGDVILATPDMFGGTKGANTYVVATNAQTKLQWASAAVTGLSLKLVSDTDFISIGTGAIGSQRVTAYRFEVVAN